MNVFDKVAQKLALRWLRKTADTARREENPMLKALDGWKGLIVVLGFIGSTLYALATGQDVGALVTAAFQAMGWGSDVGLIEGARTFATVVAPLILAIWAAGSRLWKAAQQYRAGAPPSELLSTEGYVKQALVEGRIGLGEHGPVIR